MNELGTEHTTTSNAPIGGAIQRLPNSAAKDEVVTWLRERQPWAASSMNQTFQGPSGMRRAKC
jgi:hypothetical protein